MIAVVGATEPTLEELLNATDDSTRGENSISTIGMEVHTQRFDRTMTMEVWAEGQERTLVRILTPVKDEGTATLKVGDDMWNYLPKIDRTMKIPPGMMGGSWMGSHFSNDDLVKDSRLSEEFDYELSDKTDEIYTIICTPKPDTAVVWGSVVVRVRADLIPIDVQYFDDDGDLSRTMTFDGVKELDGRLVPTVVTLIPANEPGEYTRITTIQADYDATIDDRVFSLQALRQ